MHACVIDALLAIVQLCARVFVLQVRVCMQYHACTREHHPIPMFMAVRKSDLAVCKHAGGKTKAAHSPLLVLMWLMFTGSLVAICGGQEQGERGCVAVCTDFGVPPADVPQRPHLHSIGFTDLCWRTRPSLLRLLLALNNCVLASLTLLTYLHSTANS